MAWGLTTLIAAFVGSFLAGYLRKKGENLATHEDINKLVTQVAAVTEATQSIEARISNEVWERQRQWEMKREALFEAVRAIGTMDDALITLNSTYTAAQAAGEANPETWADRKSEALETWKLASSSFDRANRIAFLVCGKDVAAALLATGLLIRKIAKQIFSGDVQNYLKLAPELMSKMQTLELAIRRELRIDQ